MCSQWAALENKVAYGPKKIPDFESKKENYLNKDKRAQVTFQYVMYKGYTKLRKNIKHFSDDYVEDEKRNCIGYEFHAMRCVY